MKTLSKSRVVITILISLLFLTACGSSNGISGAEKTLIALDVFNTQTAEAKTDGAVAPVEPAAPTDTDVPSPPIDPQAAPTDTAFTSAATPNMTYTAYAIQSQGMRNQIQSLYSDGYLDSTEGFYYKLDDATANFAKTGYVQPFESGYYLEMSDFVLRANIEWESADKNAKLAGAGCGFWFGVDEEFENFYQIMLHMNGNVALGRCLDNCTSLESIGHGEYDYMDKMEGNVDVILVYQGDTIRYFINGKELFSRSGQYELEGYLYYAISSQSSKEFGMRCTFTDIELWDMYD